MTHGMLPCSPCYTPAPQRPSHPCLRREQQQQAVTIEWRGAQWMRHSSSPLSAISPLRPLCRGHRDAGESMAYEFTRTLVNVASDDRLTNLKTHMVIHTCATRLCCCMLYPRPHPHPCPRRHQHNVCEEWMWWTGVQDSCLLAKRHTCMLYVLNREISGYHAPFALCSELRMLPVNAASCHDSRPSQSDTVSHRRRTFDEASVHGCPCCLACKR